MDLFAMDIAARRRNMKVTILHRPGDVWHNSQVDRLMNGLMTAASSHPLHPEYLMLYGHFTKEETLRAMLGGVAYTVKQITGVHQNPELKSLWVPFV